MNIFLPYEDSIQASVISLDDARLRKQILEIYQIFQVAIGNSTGYANHPIVKHYKNYPGFLVRYGALCCIEYEYRFNRRHKYHQYFADYYNNSLLANAIGGYSKPVFNYIPFYAEGSEGESNYIRTAKNVGRLYRVKLASKWYLDNLKGRTPKWTNRNVPDFINYCEIV